jgi:hypothetical protein
VDDGPVRWVADDRGHIFYYRMSYDFLFKHGMPIGRDQRYCPYQMCARLLDFYTDYRYMAMHVIHGKEVYDQNMDNYLQWAPKEVLDDVFEMLEIDNDSSFWNASRKKVVDAYRTDDENTKKRKLEESSQNGDGRRIQRYKKDFPLVAMIPYRMIHGTNSLDPRIPPPFHPPSPLHN